MLRRKRDAYVSGGGVEQGDDARSVVEDLVMMRWKLPAKEKT